MKRSSASAAVLSPTIARHLRWPVRAVARLGLLVVDVAHAGESWEQARAKIEAAVDAALARGHSGVKVIHGHGASTGRARIAPLAIQWMRTLATRTGGTFTQDRNNPGAHLIWFS